MKVLLFLSLLLCSAVFGQSTVSLLAHQKLLVANNGGQTITDLGPLYTGPAKFILTAKSDAGSSPTLAVKLQSSPPLARLVDVVAATGDTTESVAHRTGAAAALQLAAKFTLAGASSIKTIYLPLKKTGAPTGTLTAAIYADTAGDPSGSALATFPTLNVATLTTSFAQIAFDLTTVVDLPAATYHIVVTSDVATSGSVNVSWRAVTVDEDGNGNVYGSAWVPDDTINLEFQALFYQFADVTGGGFTSVTTTASTQTLEINVDTLAIIRPHITVGGTSSPAFYTSLIGLLTPVQP